MHILINNAQRLLNHFLQVTIHMLLEVVDRESEYETDLVSFHFARLDELVSDVD